MKRKNFALFVVSAALSVGVGCGGGSEDDDVDPVPTADAAVGEPDTATPTACAVTPGEWAAPQFAANAATELALRQRLDVLVRDTMRGAEQETVVITEAAQLRALYEAGNPSLADAVAPPFDAIVDDAFVDFVGAILAGPQDLVDDDVNWTPGEAGGIFGASTRAINAGGLEVRQIVDKGLFGGGALYAHALTLTEGDITPATIDALAAAWGSNAALDPEERTDSAGYSYSMGFHGDIAIALADAKAYAADADCTAERDEAIVSFFHTWEQAMLARTVFYANAGARNMAAAKSDDDRAGALHALTEGLGLAFGFYGLEAPTTGPLANAARVITDAELEAIASALGVNLTDLSASTTGEFVGDTAKFDDGVADVEAVVMDVYDLTEADIESYRVPTAG